jgi:Tol biopolymer transport system component
LQYVVNKMLAKEPEQRYQVVHNVRTDLRQMLDSGETATELFKTIRVQAVGSKWGWMVLCGFTFFALATAAILFWIHWLSTPLKPNNVSRFTVNLGQGKEIAGTARAMAISPDGKVLVYRAQLGETIKLYRRPLNQLEAIAIPGTDGADAPFFSPDSRKVGFFAGEKLKHVSLADGALVTVCEAENPVGACWAIDDTIFFSPVEGGRGLWSVPATGGVPQQVTQPKSELQHRYPEALPGGKAVLFNAREWGQHYTIRVVVLSLETGEQRVLVENAVMPLYAPSGHLVYSRGSELMAVPFDVKELEVTGSPVKVVEGLRHTTAGESAFSFSSDGALSFVPGGWTGTKNELAWVSRQGTTQPLHEPKTQYVRAALSPDDRQIAAQMSDGVGMDVFLLKIERNTLSRFTFDGRNHIAIWSPVNNRVTFTSNRDVHNNLYWKPADGSGVAERLTTSDYHQDAGSWSPDGTVLAFAELNSATTWDIWLLYLEEDSKVEPFLQNRFSEYAPMISPDGSYLAYVSNESGRREVYVQPFPEGGRRWQISTEVGYDPLWAPNGEELFYCTECDRPDCSKVMAVDVTTEPEFKAGVPRPLFEGPYRAGGGFGHSSYDITSDGQNFLVTSIGIPPPPVTQINVVLNWFEELKHRVPTE